ncbi:GTPase [Desulfosarcina sp. BuS5]|uniref:GTPase HflX n=1 Tax=Desulfosarcina sp. BuS5 TaxID=933262 RepID=UPI0004803800|nr:GTPase HflX [Desulfosarcina sp. BuS5]WDN88659.1 GTPase [Desulfosarcina sp. BuS5]
MKKIFGNIAGLKANQIKKLERLYRRRVPVEFLVTPELAREICDLSFKIKRQVGILVNRLGRIDYIIVGDHQQIFIPDLSDYRTYPGRLKGLRCIHTHFDNEPLTRDDITDLLLLKLDIMATVNISEEGRPAIVHIGHILPNSTDGNFYRIQTLRSEQLNIGCLDLINAVEDELAHARTLYEADKNRERALLVSITTDSSVHKAEEGLDELRELARTSGIEVVETVIQRRKRIDPRFLMGLGKLQEIIIIALQNAVTMIIFDQELNPSQTRSLTDKIDLKVIDRTQLILDIFAQRAQTREGKLQVELAQLKYLLPHLVIKNRAMSRLTGGIGGRGPGETKLEINRRRVRDRIARLEKEVSRVKKQRRQQKARRNKKGLPIISIVGYTNAGKSTLLNTLTKSKVITENRLFATLDPASRRLKFPRDVEVILTDTVGFIKDLPKELMVAFRATMEELESADLLLHVIDISNPYYNDHIESVEKILVSLKLEHIPVINVLNKKDLVDNETLLNIKSRLDGIPITAKSDSTLTSLINKMQAAVKQRAFPV